jgi:CheY-like chemotaxis protein
MDACASTARLVLVLVDDDEPVVREAVAELMRVQGWDTRSVGTIEQALGLLRAERFPLLITDIRLGQGTGYDLVAQAVSEGICPRVLYVTGYAGQDQAHTEGGERLLVKPFSTKQLAEAVSDLMG